MKHWHPHQRRRRVYQPMLHRAWFAAELRQVRRVRGQAFCRVGKLKGLMGAEALKHWRHLMHVNG